MPHLKHELTKRNLEVSGKRPELERALLDVLELERALLAKQATAPDLASSLGCAETAASPASEGAAAPTPAGSAPTESAGSDRLSGADEQHPSSSTGAEQPIVTDQHAGLERIAGGGTASTSGQEMRRSGAVAGSPAVAASQRPVMPARPVLPPRPLWAGPVHLRHTDGPEIDPLVRTACFVACMVSEQTVGGIYECMPMPRVWDWLMLQSQMTASAAAIGVRAGVRTGVRTGVLQAHT